MGNHSAFFLITSTISFCASDTVIHVLFNATNLPSFRCIRSVKGDFDFMLDICVVVAIVIHQIDAFPMHSDLSDEFLGTTFDEENKSDNYDDLSMQRRLAMEGILIGRRGFPTEGILLGKRGYPTEGILLGKRAYPNEGILLGKRFYPTQGILLGKRNLRFFLSKSGITNGLEN
jgi:hypothetical protein